MSREEYVKRKQENERMIAHWETRTTETEKKAIELSTCLEALSLLVSWWPDASGDDRLALARGLFEYIVFDLDKQQIVDFQLHPWASHYLTLRADLYGRDDDCSAGQGNKNASPVSSDEAIHDPNGASARKTIRNSGIPLAKEFILFVVYYDQDQNAMPTVKQRDARIRERYAQGEAISDLAREHGLSPQRVFQIVKERRK